MLLYGWDRFRGFTTQGMACMLSSDQGDGAEKGRGFITQGVVCMLSSHQGDRAEMGRGFITQGVVCMLSSHQGDGEKFHHTGGGLHAFITPGRWSRDGES